MVATNPFEMGRTRNKLTQIQVPLADKMIVWVLKIHAHANIFIPPPQKKPLLTDFILY